MKRIEQIIPCTSSVMVQARFKFDDAESNEDTFGLRVMAWALVHDDENDTTFVTGLVIDSGDPPGGDLELIDHIGNEFSGYVTHPLEAMSI